MRQPSKRRGVSTLGRSSRLLKSKDFQRVAREGRRVSSIRFVMLVAPGLLALMPTDAGAEPLRRLGITTSRKVGSAVARNRIRRGVREWFRRSRTHFGGNVDVVVIAKVGAARLGVAEISNDLSALCEQWEARARRHRG